ncbi:MAG: O-antigen ligase family protein [Planctomycetota bacterium]
MSKVESAGALILPPILAISASLFMTLVFLVATGMTNTWIALILLGLMTGTGVFWAADIKRVLLYVFVFTASIDINKALIVEGGVLAPGLSLTVADVFFFPLVLVWLWDKKVIRKERIDYGDVRWPMWLFLGWMWLTAILSLERFGGILAAITYSKYFLTTVVLADIIRDVKTLRGVLCVFAAGLVLQILMVSAQFVTRSHLEIQGAKATELGTKLVFEQAGGLHVFRPSGFLHHPNVLADYLTFLLPTMLLFLLQGPQRIGKTTWTAAGVLFVGGMGAMVVSLSRGGWIAFGAAVVFLLYMGFRKRLVRQDQIVFFAAVAFLGGIVTIVAFPAAYYRITQSDQRSAESRWAMTEQALLIIRRNPVFGVGLGGYNRAAQQNIPPSFSNISEYFQQKLLEGIVHNRYLLTASEHGIPGIVFLFLLVGSFIVAYLRVPRWADPSYCLLGLGLASSLVAQLVFYAFDHFYTDIRILLCWVAFGILAALLKINKKSLEKLDREAALAKSPTGNSPT